MINYSAHTARAWREFKLAAVRSETINQKRDEHAEAEMALYNLWLMKYSVTAGDWVYYCVQHGSVRINLSLHPVCVPTDDNC